MSYLDDASLVVIPSGYKPSTVFAVKPTDGTGDLTFTRSNDTATRVGPDGLIEKVRTNLVLQSNGFDTASWTKSGAGTGLAPVVTANAGTAPDGTNNAFRIQFDCVGTTSADRSRITQNITSALSTQYTYSFYIKAFSAGDVGKQVRFIVESSTTQAVVTLTADWQRIISTGTTSSTSPVFLLETRGGVTVSTTADVLLAFVQAETGDIATDYIATTTAAVSVGPVANVPRLDYLNSSCPRLLLEPQRTNLNTFSDNLDNAAYVKQNCTVSANNTASPSGYVDADKIVEDTANTNKNCRFPNTSLTSGTTYNVSFFAKPDNCDVIAIREGAVSGDAITYKFSTGTTSLQGTRFTSLVVTDYANGFKRISVNFLPTSTAAHNFRIQLLGNAYNQTTNTNAGTYTYLGDGVSGVWAWGCTVEVGNYPTSYIPTLGAAVTRGADAASKTGISSLIGQTEGTLFVEFIYSNASLSGSPSQYFSISDGTSNERIFVGEDSGTTGKINARVIDGNVLQVNFLSSFNMVLGQRYKAAIAYKANDFAFYVNGVQVGASSSGTVPTMSQIQNNSGAGASQMYYPIAQTLLFPTRLSNSDLAALTA